MEFLDAILANVDDGWIWLVVAAVLFALDVMAPGFFFLWFGLSAVVVGLIVFVVPLEYRWQLLAFSGFSVLAVIMGRAVWGSGKEIKTDQPLLNQRAQQLIGNSYILETAIHGGRGRIRAGDGAWSVKGSDLPQGSVVRVIGAEGTLLLVEAADSEPAGLGREGSSEGP